MQQQLENAQMRLSAEVANEGDEVLLYVDREGLEYLQQQLNHLNRTDHIHLFSPEWGGSDLTDHPPEFGGNRIHHIKVFFVADADDEREGG